MSLKKMMLVPLRFIEVGNDPSEISFGVLQAEFHGAGPSEILFEVCVAAPDKQKNKNRFNPSTICWSYGAQRDKNFTGQGGLTGSFCFVYLFRLKS